MVANRSMMFHINEAQSKARARVVAKQGEVERCGFRSGGFIIPRRRVTIFPTPSPRLTGVSGRAKGGEPAEARQRRNVSAFKTAVALRSDMQRSLGRQRMKPVLTNFE
jgi:hypothetical protein